MFGCNIFVPVLFIFYLFSFSVFSGVGFFFFGGGGGGVWGRNKGSTSKSDTYPHSNKEWADESYAYKFLKKNLYVFHVIFVITQYI